MEDENRRLRLTNSQLESTTAVLTQQVKSLTSDLDQRQRGTTAAGTQQDHVQFLVEQAKQFRADFESEKRDRIAAEARINELQQRLSATNAQVIYLLIFTCIIGSECMLQYREHRSCLKTWTDQLFAID